MCCAVYCVVVGVVVFVVGVVVIVGDGCVVSDALLAVVDDYVGADIACCFPSAGVICVTVGMIDVLVVSLLFHLVIIDIVVISWSVLLS